MKKPEILAPAGSMEALKAAVAAGCDAVYLGGSRFGARAYADNLEQEQMTEAIAYCHLHGVRLYLTVNTLLKERELKEGLFDYLAPYYEAGLDAVIVQDVGVIKYIHENFPRLPIHASTQMTLTGAQGAEMLKKYYVERIVPARELTLEELRQMRKNTDLEMEVFVHGALCYCYSGQCLLSSMQGSRSGNRGRCAQPCRMPYSTDGRKASYILSPKELCNLRYIPELIEAGVDSFKIEGRMKRAEYTAFVTAMYRKYVDLYCALGAKGYQQHLSVHKKEWEEDLRCLAELYNRNGFTQGYLEGKMGTVKNALDRTGGEMLSDMRPKHGGVLVGKVEKADKYQVTYEVLKDISGQDVVEFRDSSQQPSYEYTLKDPVRKGEHITARYMKGCKIRSGDLVYRTKDAKLLAKIQERYFAQEQQPLTGTFLAKQGEPMELTLHFRGETVIQKGGECAAAQKQPAQKESVEKTLRQTGNSEFYFERLEVILEDNLFLPVGSIKQLRREAFLKLKEKVVSKYYRVLPQRKQQKENSFIRNKEKNMQRVMTAQVMTGEQLEAVLETEQIKKVYIGTETFSQTELVSAFHALRQVKKEAWLVLPTIFREETSLVFEKERQRADGLFSLAWDGFLIKNYESYAFLTKKADIPAEKIRTDYNLYIMNGYGRCFWEEQGVCLWTIPVELTKEEIASLTFIQGAELIVYGKTPVMTSAQCVCANTDICQKSRQNGRRAGQNRVMELQDGKGRRFEAVNYCKYCYNVIYQKRPVWIFEEAEKLPAFRFVDCRFVFTTESKTEVQKIVKGEMCEKVLQGHFHKGME